MKTQEQMIPVGEHLFEETIRLTNIQDYGTDWQQLISGQVAPGPAGAFFELAFEGKVQGERIRGTITGTDFLEVRADGCFNMHIHATITTDDGERVSLVEEGPLLPPSEPGGKAGVRLSVRFRTGSQKYGWLNQTQAWVTGEADQATGTVSVQAYRQ